MQSIFDFIKNIHNNIITTIGIALTVIVGFIIYFLQKRDSKKINSNKKTNNKNTVNENILRENILINYPLDKRTGLHIDFTKNVLCPKCIHESPPVEQTMNPEEYHWVCPKCNHEIRNDTPLATGSWI